MLTLSVLFPRLKEQMFLKINDYTLSDSIEVIEEILASGGEFKMYPKGKSMLPFIVEGEDAVVLVKQTDKLKKNDIAFYRRDNGQFVLHRVVKTMPDGSYVMCGDNQIYLEKGITDSQIIGVLSRLYKREKLFNDKAFSYKIYRAFWCCLPVRRLIRFPRRCIGKLCKIIKKI